MTTEIWKKRNPHIDFSKHILTEDRRDGFLKHTLALSDSGEFRTVFINTEGILAITGDLGNWIFEREFHPSPKGFVSDGYWLEKIDNKPDKRGKRQLSIIFDAFEEICRRLSEVKNV